MAASIMSGASRSSVAENSEDVATMAEWVPKSFAIDEENATFTLDGKPFVPRSGEVHYFMMRPENWDETLSFIKEANLNCVTTTVEWAQHEPFPGMYDFENELDLRGFIELAFKKRLKVILKIGPQSSPDRDLGGLPHWLLTVNPEMKFRVQDESFMFFLGRWLQKLYGVTQPCLTGNGGPIIMIQIEDAYGSYPINDRNYLYWLRDVNRTYVGDKALLFTSDFNDKYSIERGYIHGVLATVKFGAASEKTVEGQFEGLKAVQPKGPLMNSQYWVGSPTYWKDEEHKKLDAKVLLSDVADFITGGIGFNLHLFKGGTNFGLTAGEREGKYCMTSYDCDALISEARDPTKKWALIRDLITGITDEEYAQKTEEEQREFVENILKDSKEPEPKKKGEYGTLLMTPVESFMNAFQTSCCGKSCASLFPKSMEEMCLKEGFLAYTTKLKNDVDRGSVLKGSIRDRAYVIINMTEPLGTMEDNTELKLPKALEEGTKITFVVDNLGRGAYEPGKQVTKGLFNMYLNNEYMDDWVITTYSVRGPKSIEKLHNLLRKKLRDKNKPPPPTGLNTNAANTQSLWFGANSNANVDPNAQKPTEIAPPAFYYGTFTNDKDDGPDNKKNKDVVHELDLESDVNYDNMGDHFQDSYLNLSGWKKGIVYLNEWCLGRYWCVGPQQTLYVPGAYIRPYPWKNKITILELRGAPKDPKVNFVPEHIYATAPEDPKEAEKDDATEGSPNLSHAPNGAEEQSAQKAPGEEAALSKENVGGNEPKKEPENELKEGFSRESPKQGSQLNVTKEPSNQAQNGTQEVEDTPPQVEEEPTLN